MSRSSRFRWKFKHVLFFVQLRRTFQSIVFDIVDIKFSMYGTFSGSCPQSRNYTVAGILKIKLHHGGTVVESLKSLLARENKQKHRDSSQ